jgi:hypothetical protein
MEGKIFFRDGFDDQLEPAARAFAWRVSLNGRKRILVGQSPNRLESILLMRAGKHPDLAESKAMQCQLTGAKCDFAYTAYFKPM